jgi:hypothetical protein
MVAASLGGMLVASTLAYGAGYPTKLPKRVEDADLSVSLAGITGSRLGIEPKTNSRGQIATVISGQISGIPAKCTQGSEKLGTQSLASVENVYRVRASGAFSYTEDIPNSSITVAVAGRFSDRGKRVAGTATFSSGTTPGSYYADTNCTTKPAGALRWSGKPHWQTFL